MLKDPLFQVYVERGEQLLAVSPKMPKEGCEILASAIERMIIDGREKDWRKPQIVPVAA